MLDAFEQFVDRVVVSEVAPDDDCGTTSVVDRLGHVDERARSTHRGGLADAATGQVHHRSAVAEYLCDPPSNASTGAGYDGYSAGQIGSVPPLGNHVTRS
jgi:hypothetical protein